MTRWLAALVVGGHVAGACTIVHPVVTAGPDFSVAIEDRGRPVEGVTVVLSRSGVSVVRVVTDKSGSAQFRNVAPGSYFVAPEPDAGIGTGSGVEVKAKSSAPTIVRLKWPSEMVLVTRSLKGSVRVPGGIRDESQRTVLELREARTGRVLQKADLPDSATFDFSSAGAGLYFLTLRFGAAMGGSTAVEVNPSASSPYLDLDTEWTSCGAYFSDLNACRSVDLNVSSFSGRIADSSGGLIPNARVLLLDVNGRAVEERFSDERGVFDSIRPATGSYRLEVYTHGFTTFRANWTVNAEGNAAQFEVRLGLIGACGTASPY